ncbi:hypothetical protein HSBAA_19100 [Vreelandella sulfidaeris]|uniref:Peptidase S24/S26A/S26B/S26C domain-containing protein n=1 Tax=Vreelandella sulfidaeris TaxID=115553 RepID=A0A455UBJ4_9GAMM|nr:hypothetical protein HSBAA_19100 [Halomonas sulfidaeris]
MEGWGIFEGDLLIVDRGIEPRLGHILVAMLEGEALIKRYALYQGTPHLCSTHPHYPPVPLEGSDCQLWVWCVPWCTSTYVELRKSDDRISRRQ